MTDDQQPPREAGAATRPPGAGGGPRRYKASRTPGGTGTGTEGGGGAAGGAGTGTGTGGAAVRRLTRSRQHKIVGGVCGGLGRYFGLDPVVFRVPLAVLSVVGGLGLVFYGFAWLVVPAEGERDNEVRRLLSGRVEGASLSALLAALVGCGLFLTSVGSSDAPFSFSLAVAGAVIAAVYWSQRRRKAEPAGGAEGAAVHPATAHAVADAPPETRAPPVPSSPSWWREPRTAGGAEAQDTGYLWGPDDETPYTPEDGAAFRRRRRRERQSIGGLVFLLACSAAVLVPSVSWATQPLATSLTLSLGSALTVFGLGLAVTAFVGRVGGGTITAVGLTAVLLAGAVLLPKDITAQWGDMRWTPEAATEVRNLYELGTGRGVLDLSGLDLREGQTVRTEVRVGAGELRAVVPDDVAVRVDFEVGLGGYRLPPGAGAPDGGGGAGGGVGVAASHTLRPVGGGEPRGTLVLDLDVGIGEAAVAQAETAPDRTDGGRGADGTNGTGRPGAVR